MFKIRLGTWLFVELRNSGANRDVNLVSEETKTLYSHGYINRIIERYKTLFIPYLQEINTSEHYDNKRIKIRIRL